MAVALWSSGCAAHRAGLPPASAAASTSVVTSPSATVAQPAQVVVEPSPRVAAVTAYPQRHLPPEVEQQLRTVDPKRVYHTAVAKPGVPQLAIVGPAEQRIAAGGSATLSVHATPAALVTFATSDGGEFVNRAASITVLADDQGLAQTVMTAPRGTLDDVPVHVGSPTAIGTVTMVVHVYYPGSSLLTLAAP